jgi:hypothetical protein
MLRLRGNVVRVIVDLQGKYDYDFAGIRTECDNIEFDDVNRGERPQKKIHILNTTSSAVEPVVMHMPDYLTAEFRLRRFCLDIAA